MAETRISSRKFLVRELVRNIDLDRNNSYKFNEHIFTRDGLDSYEIAREDGFSLGTYDVNVITDHFLRAKIVKYTKKEKNKGYSMKSKPRKKKRYDVICNEFMGFVKEQPCIVDGCTRGNSEAHHIYGRQPARHDNLCVPLCPYHHRGSEFSVHEGNVRDFRNKYPRDEMEIIALSIFVEWLKNNTDDEFMTSLGDKLTATSKKHSIAIKEFIIGRRDT